MQHSIYPYLLGKTWVFDDATTRLKQEAFVLGSSEAISQLVATKRIANAAGGFSLTFSDEPFEGFDAQLDWVRAHDATQFMPGNWHRGEIGGALLEGWLCPALLLFFRVAPKCIYVRAEPLPAGIDPIWHVDPGDPRQRRFMSSEDSII
jgi:hypothetical protein